MNQINIKKQIPRKRPISAATSNIIPHRPMTTKMPQIITLGSTPLNTRAIASSASKNVPAFLNKLYNMVNDSSTNDLIHWSEDGTTFIVQRHEDFAKEVLPRFFKHNNFSSFVRQLNMYGFHKVPHLQQGVLHSDSETELWEFANPHFQKNQPDLLCLVNRKKGRDNEDKETLNINNLITEIAAVKRHQYTISSDLKNIQRESQLLWNETLNMRELYQRQKETIDKIIRFLASFFTTKKNVQSPKRRRLLIEDSATAALSSKKRNENNSNDINDDINISSLPIITTPTLDIDNEILSNKNNNRKNSLGSMSVSTTTTNPGIEIIDDEKEINDKNKDTSPIMDLIRPNSPKIQKYPILELVPNSTNSTNYNQMYPMENNINNISNKTKDRTNNINSNNNDNSNINLLQYMSDIPMLPTSDVNQLQQINNLSSHINSINNTSLNVESLYNDINKLQVNLENLTSSLGIDHNIDNINNTEMDDFLYNYENSQTPNLLSGTAEERERLLALIESSMSSSSPIEHLSEDMNDNDHINSETINNSLGMNNNTYNNFINSIGNNISSPSSKITLSSSPSSLSNNLSKNINENTSPYISSPLSTASNDSYQHIHNKSHTITNKYGSDTTMKIDNTSTHPLSSSSSIVSLAPSQSESKMASVLSNSPLSNPTSSSSSIKSIPVVNSKNKNNNSNSNITKSNLSSLNNGILTTKTTSAATTIASPTTLASTMTEPTTTNTESISISPSLYDQMKIINNNTNTNSNTNTNTNSRIQIPVINPILSSLHLGQTSKNKLIAPSPQMNSTSIIKSNNNAKKSNNNIATTINNNGSSNINTNSIPSSITNQSLKNLNLQNQFLNNSLYNGFNNNQNGTLLTLNNLNTLLALQGIDLQSLASANNGGSLPNDISSLANMDKGEVSNALFNLNNISFPPQSSLSNNQNSIMDQLNLISLSQLANQKMLNSSSSPPSAASPNITNSLVNSNNIDSGIISNSKRSNNLTSPAINSSVLASPAQTSSALTTISDTNNDSSLYLNQNGSPLVLDDVMNTSTAATPAESTIANANSSLNLLNSPLLYLNPSTASALMNIYQPLFSNYNGSQGLINPTNIALNNNINTIPTNNVLTTLNLSPTTEIQDTIKPNDLISNLTKSSKEIKKSTPDLPTTTTPTIPTSLLNPNATKPISTLNNTPLNTTNYLKKF